MAALRYLSTLIGLFIHLWFWRFPREICRIFRSEGAESEVPDRHGSPLS